MPTISIIIPIYNAELYLAECLDLVTVAHVHEAVLLRLICKLIIAEADRSILFFANQFFYYCHPRFPPNDSKNLCIGYTLLL